MQHYRAPKRDTNSAAVLAQRPDKSSDHSLSPQGESEDNGDLYSDIADYDMEDTSSLSGDSEAYESPSEAAEEKEIRVKTGRSWRPPARMLIGGHLFRLRKQRSGKQYWYCVVAQCPAGYVYCEETSHWKANSHDHNHPIEVMNPTQLRQNQEEIALRLFVHEHFEMDSHGIYSLLLRNEFDDHPQYQHLPCIESINIKRIQNIKSLLTGASGRGMLRSLLPPTIAELGGRQFLRFHSVVPIILIFATCEGLELIDEARRFMLMRLNLTGNEIEFVYCAYTVDDQCLRPVAWILSAQRNAIPWLNFKSLLDERLRGKPLGIPPRTWIVPCAESYMGILRSLLNFEDEVVGLAVTYHNKVTKITSEIPDADTREGLTSLFLSVGAKETETIGKVLDKANEKYPSSEAKRAINDWETSFKNRSFLIHSASMCRDDTVQLQYQRNKNQPEKRYETDMQLLHHIRELAEGHVPE